MENIIRWISCAINLGCLLWGTAACAEQLTICIDYHCEEQQDVSLSGQHMAYINQPLTHAADARQERRQIAVAIGRFEEITGQLTGTSQDMAKNQGEDETGQLDCIAESLNTERYLHILQQNRRLQYHRVAARQKRTWGFISPHWSAFIEDTSSGKRYSVDSWHYANGEPPVIQPEADWHNHEPVDNQRIP